MNEDKLLYKAKMDAACLSIDSAETITGRGCPIIGFGLRGGGLGCLELTRDEPIPLWSLEAS